MKLTFTPVPTHETYFRNLTLGTIFFYPKDSDNKFIRTERTEFAVCLGGKDYILGHNVMFGDVAVVRREGEFLSNKRKFGEIAVGTYFHYSDYTAIWLKFADSRAILIAGTYGSFTKDGEYGIGSNEGFDLSTQVTVLTMTENLTSKEK